MSPSDSIKQDLQYVANAVRRRDRSPGVPAIYFLWAFIVLVGFALPDLAPKVAGSFWLVAGFGGGLLSWYLGHRDALKNGVIDGELGRRHGFHWLVGGVAFLGVALPVVMGRADMAATANSFMLVAALLYTLAGVHLERPLLWSGLVMFAAYAVLVVYNPPHAWTFAGIATAISLVWAGVSTQRADRASAPGMD
ncbi:MAG: hypothetical protein A3E01_05805 [Gammaproteobacteria bacterium RIFCSPHIGHO2_12_FULL_63_22]|nr:MAG: hypothetical protein A3E01_05805 [Gammaproteobacteria bacterium RIFCSPHIGHO2_12_FULL_63_22]